MHVQAYSPVGTKNIHLLKARVNKRTYWTVRVTDTITGHVVFEHTCKSAKEARNLYNKAEHHYRNW